MTARVRIHLLTYKRPNLLRRAVDSLLAQTLQDWTCELHNDAPDDPFPGELCRTINDRRIQYVPHQRNLGPTASFNLLFKNAAEPYLSLLEDDNWWEPDFLQEMVSTLDGLPNVDVPLDLRPRVLVHERSDVGALLSPVAKLERARSIHEPAKELIVDSTLQN